MNKLLILQYLLPLSVSFNCICQPIYFKWKNYMKIGIFPKVKAHGSLPHCYDLIKQKTNGNLKYTGRFKFVKNEGHV